MKRAHECQSALIHWAMNAIWVLLALPVFGCGQAGQVPITVGAQLIVPANCMTNELWDIEPLSQVEVNQFLSKKLPATDQVPPQATDIEVFEEYCGKRVVWIPPEARPREDELRSQRSYAKNLLGYAKTLGQSGASGKPVPGPQIGHFLVGFLASITELGPEWARSRDEQVVYVVILTKRNLLIIAVPRDYTCSDIPPVSVQRLNGPRAP